MRSLPALTFLAITSLVACGGGVSGQVPDGGGEGEGEGEGEDPYHQVLAGSYVSLIAVRTLPEVYYQRHYGILHDEPYMLVLSTDDGGVRHISSVDLESGDATVVLDVDAVASGVIFNSAIAIGDEHLAVWTANSQYVTEAFLVDLAAGSSIELGNVESLSVPPTDDALVVTEKCEEQLVTGCRVFTHVVSSGDEEQLAADGVDSATWTLEGGDLLAVLHVDRTLEVLTWPALEPVTTVEGVARIFHAPGVPGQEAFYYTLQGETFQDLYAMTPDGTSTLLKPLVYDVQVDQRAVYYTTQADGAFVREHGSDSETLVVDAGTIGNEIDNHLDSTRESPEGGYAVLNWSTLGEAYLVNLDDPGVDTTVALPLGECGGFRSEAEYLHPCYSRPRLYDIAGADDGSQFPTIGHVFGISADATYAVAETADEQAGISLLTLDDPGHREILVATAISDIDERSRFVAMFSATEPNVLYYLTNNPNNAPEDKGLFRYEQR